MYLRGIIILFVSVSQVLTEKCITPNNEQAECISLYSCPVLIGVLATQQTSAIEFVRKSSCGGTASNPMVCCGPVSFFTPSERKEPESTIGTIYTENLLADRRYCGYQHSDDYFRAGNDTSIDELPWMALLLFTTNNISTEVRCSGSLINNKYVLTAAHCLLSREYTLTAVRLGDYNIQNQTDCVENSQYSECSEPVEEFGIERTILHSLYNPLTKANDVALLRLNKTVQYSDFIRPICLPTPGTTFAEIGDTLTTSDWGAAETKTKILTKLVNNIICAEAYNNNRKVITENHLCIKELDINADCHGDSGAPLLFSHRNQWHQEGILSFGSCSGGTPNVYTKVVNYLDWIKETVQP